MNGTLSFSLRRSGSVAEICAVALGHEADGMSAFRRPLRKAFIPFPASGWAKTHPPPIRHKTAIGFRLSPDIQHDEISNITRRDRGRR